MSSGDIAWVLISTALVMLMTPAVGFFYGGMSGRKNVVSVLMQSLVILCLVTVQWVTIGYSLAFGPDVGGIIGSLQWFGLSGVGFQPEPAYAATVPHQAFMLFQAMFAVIAPALIIGSFVGRIRFGAFVIFTLLWTTFVYDPLAHWVWGNGGWLRSLGALDFAGGTVVHISAGLSALAAAMVVGKRSGVKIGDVSPHNVPMILLGAALLWFGWFGFNGGSALAANGLAVNAVVVTTASAATAALASTGIGWARTGKTDLLSGATGAVAGLVAITPASGFVNVPAALAIGLGAGAVCHFAIAARIKMGLDDTLDVWACHGMGGIWGALATGLLASKAVNPAGADGALFGNLAQLGVQSLAVIVTCAFSFGATFGILKLLDATIGLRVARQEESVGLDIMHHGTEAYGPHVQG